VVSPEIAGDRTVTFRIYAPKAIEVMVTGDWMSRTDKPIPLLKRDDGVWVGTAEPNVYLYGFNVDGVRTTDPENSNTIVTGGRFAQSSLEIRGEVPLPCEGQTAHKGTIHIEFFDSMLQRRERSYYVYAPPGYENKRGTGLPVLVLLPGTPGTEADWSQPVW
jgi:enterochelin esterase-like enzyme